MQRGATSCMDDSRAGGNPGFVSIFTLLPSAACHNRVLRETYVEFRSLFKVLHTSRNYSSYCKKIDFCYFAVKISQNLYQTLYFRGSFCLLSN